MQATERMLLLEDSFHASLVNRSSEIRTTLPKHPEARKPDVHKHSQYCCIAEIYSNNRRVQNTVKNI